MNEIDDKKMELLLKNALEEKENPDINTNITLKAKIRCLDEEYAKTLVRLFISIFFTTNIVEISGVILGTSIFIKLVFAALLVISNVFLIVTNVVIINNKKILESGDLL